MRKLATNKSLYAEIRELYGWTQEQVATYLGIGRSLFSLCESGDRTLPSSASLAWLEWIKFSAGNDNLKKATAALALPPPDTKKLLRQATNCEWEALKLQRELPVMQKRYDQTVNSIALCQHLLGLTPDIKKNELARSQLEVSLSIARRIQRDHGLEALALLQCKINSLLYEAEQCRQQIAMLVQQGSEK